MPYFPRGSVPAAGLMLGKVSRLRSGRLRSHGCAGVLGDWPRQVKKGWKNDCIWYIVLWISYCE
jgi:hypothetical protein